MESKKLINNFIVLLIFFFTLFVIFSDVLKLGFFADDISVINGIIEIKNLNHLINFNKSFDAARELQSIWMLFFISLTKLKNIEFLHIIQIIIYLINSFFLLYILKILKIKKEICIFVWFYFLFFPLYAEVAFWTHNIGMTLSSAFFFLIFLILNIKLHNDKNDISFFKEFIIILLFILSIFTYEQPLFIIYLIITLRILLKKNKDFSIKKKLSVLIIHSLIFISFAVYKINEMKKSQLSGINIDLHKIMDNLISSIMQPLKSILLFDYSINDITINTVLLILINLLLIFYLLKNLSFNNYKISKPFAKTTSIKITFCIVFYITSMIPLYFHYISPRHFYIPSIFIFIGIAFFLDYFLKKNFFDSIFVKIIFLLIIISSLNNSLNFNSIKYSQISNYKVKTQFYKNIDKEFGKESNINLVNFPNLRYNINFFAHEQSEVMQFMLKNKNLPLISINSTDDKILDIKFQYIKDDKIYYKVKSY